jgi:hypothetical protein
MKKLSPNKKWLFMKNLMPLYLALVCTMPLCWGMWPEDPDEYRKLVLHKSAQKGYVSYQEMHYKIRTIISNQYIGMEDLTEKEQNYLLKEFLLRDGDTQNLSFTEQVFFERFIAWTLLKNSSANLVSESKNIPSISPNSVFIDQILAKIEPFPHINYQNNCAPSAPEVDDLNGNKQTLAIRKKNTPEPFSRNFSETLSIILPTEEIPLTFDEDEGSGYFFPERLS